MGKNGFDPKAVREHFEARIKTSTALIQDLGVLVKAGSIKKQQQTYVGSAVWNGRPKRGSGGDNACHVSPGGIYVVYQSGDPHFGRLIKTGFTPNDRGYLSAPVSFAPASESGQDLISKQLTATNLHPRSVNLIDLAAEGTRGNQLPRSAGEKTKLEHSVSTVKLTTGRDTPIGVITNLAITQTLENCTVLTKRLREKDSVLSSYEKNASGRDRALIEEQREILNLKLDVLNNPYQVLDSGLLVRDASLLYEYEMDAGRSETAKIESTIESYRAQEAAASTGNTGLG